MQSGRLEAITSASQVRGDGLQAKLAEMSELDYVICHKNCISRYVSPSNLASIKKCTGESSGLQTEKKRLRSADGGVTFDFKEHCLFCLDTTPCSLEVDTKVPQKCRNAASLVPTDKLGDRQDY